MSDKVNKLPQPVAHFPVWYGYVLLGLCILALACTALWLFHRSFYGMAHDLRAAAHEEETAIRAYNASRYPQDEPPPAPPSKPDPSKP